MAYFSIKDLEVLSGIKAHTIRIWERRYSLILPERTDTNIRYYNEQELRKLLNVALLNRNGFKISAISAMSQDQLNHHVSQLCFHAQHQSVHIEKLLLAMLELDESMFADVLASVVENKGFDSAIELVLFPFLERIGVLWQMGTISPAHEHFISCLIRQKLMVAIDSEIQKKHEKRRLRMVFFTPEGEWHDIGLLFFSLVARRMGCDVVYLGASVPCADLQLVNRLRPFDALFVSVVGGRRPDEWQRLFDELDSHFSHRPVFVAGLQFKMADLQLADNIVFCDSIATFKQRLSSLLIDFQSF